MKSFLATGRVALPFGCGGSAQAELPRRLGGDVPPDPPGALLERPRAQHLLLEPRRGRVRGRPRVALHDRQHRGRGPPGGRGPEIRRGLPEMREHALRLPLLII